VVVGSEKKGKEKGKLGEVAIRLQHSVRQEEEEKKLQVIEKKQSGV